MQNLPDAVDGVDHTPLHRVQQDALRRLVVEVKRHRRAHLRESRRCAEEGGVDGFLFGQAHGQGQR